MEEYSIIKLTGQSCKIDIFRDALKEFVPGRTIQFKRRSGDLTKDFELKMTCVDGALKYLKDMDGRERYQYTCYSTQADFKEQKYVQIREQQGEHIQQADTDAIVEQEVKFFIWVRRWTGHFL